MSERGALDGTVVVLTRRPEDERTLPEQLRRLGAEVIELPCMRSERERRPSRDYRTATRPIVVPSIPPPAADRRAPAARPRDAARPLRLGPARVRRRARGGVQRVGSLLTLFFTDRPVRNENDAMTSDRHRFAAFHRAMLERHVMLPPSQFECWFVSLAHDETAVDEVLAAARASLQEVA